MRALASIALLIATLAAAQPVATLDTTTLRIGEQIHLQLDVPYRVDGGAVNIQWPVITDTLTGKVSVVKDSGVDTILPYKDQDPYAFVQRRILTITSFDSGYWAVPPFRFVINGDTLNTDPFLLTVHTVEVDTAAAPRDIKEIYEVPFSLTYWLKQNWPWIAGGVAVLAGIFLLVRWLKRRSKKEPELPVEPEKPLHLRTLLALEAIAAKRLWQQGHVKQYHSEVTDLLREYVEERYGVPALESTTDELLAALRTSAMPPAAQQQLGNLLRLADLVKFAKYSALPTENEQLMSAAERFIQETTPGHEALS